MLITYWCRLETTYCLPLLCDEYNCVHTFLHGFLPLNRIAKEKLNLSLFYRTVVFLCLINKKSTTILTSRTESVMPERCRLRTLGQSKAFFTPLTLTKAESWYLPGTCVLVRLLTDHIQTKICGSILVETIL